VINPFRNDAVGKLIVRATVSILILFHGVSKILNPGVLGFIKGQLANLGLPSAIAYGVYVGEVVAPLMILAGFRSRVGGLLVVINMIFAILLVHSGDIFTLTKNGGWTLELQGFYLFCGLAVLFLGSGRIAVKPD